VGSGPDFVDEDQFVFGAVEAAHAAIGLVPDAEVLEFGEGGFACGLLKPKRRMLSAICRICFLERRRALFA